MFTLCSLILILVFKFVFFFSFLHLQPVILDYLASKAISSDDLVVVSPDVGGVARARAFAKKLSDAPLAIVDKRRQGHNVAEVRFTYKLVSLCSMIVIFEFSFILHILIQLEIFYCYFYIFACALLQVMNLIGDVKGKVAVMVDDMIDTAGQL